MSGSGWRGRDTFLPLPVPRTIIEIYVFDPAKSLLGCMRARELEPDHTTMQSYAAVARPVFVVFQTI